MRSSGNPSIFPNDLLISSGHRLEPPMPSSKTCEKPASLTSSEKFEKRRILLCCSSTMLSQPSHLPSLLLVHSEASRAHNRLTLSLASQSSSAASTAADKSGGRAKVC